MKNAAFSKIEILGSKVGREFPRGFIFTTGSCKEEGWIGGKLPWSYAFGG